MKVPEIHICSLVLLWAPGAMFDPQQIFYKYDAEIMESQKSSFKKRASFASALNKDFDLDHSIGTAVEILIPSVGSRHSWLNCQWVCQLINIQDNSNSWN